MRELLLLFLFLFFHCLLSFFCWLFSLLIFPYFSADTLLSSYFNGMIWSLSCLRVCTSYYDFNEMHDNMLHSKLMWTHLLFFFLFSNTMIVRIINKITSLNLNWMIHNKVCLFRSSYIHSMKAHTILYIHSMKEKFIVKERKKQWNVFCFLLLDEHFSLRLFLFNLNSKKVCNQPFLHTQTHILKKRDKY